MATEAKAEGLLDEAVAKGDGVDTIVKAYFVGQDGGTKSQQSPEPDKQMSLFQSSGSLVPLYDPAGLAIVYENSSCLRANVEAYITNIDSFGHQFVPIIDLSQPRAREHVKNAIMLERKAEKTAALLAANESITPEQRIEILKPVAEPTDEEIQARIDQLEVEIAQERVELEVFFDNASVDIPFSGPEGLRGLTRHNLEVIGNGYWEVLRDGLGQIAQFNHLAATSMRLMPIDDLPTEVEISVRVSPLTWAKRKAYKRFRRFIQCWEFNTKVIYFKEFGDPRCVSAETGRIYKDLDAMKLVEGKDGHQVREATEVFWFKISSLRTAYGAPRWIGALLAVLGNRQSEESNFLYFENRSVPPLAILVSGGRLAANSVATIEEHIREHIKGSRNNHKILILEAEPASSMQNAAGASGTPSRMKIELKPLTEAQLQDATFQSYDERNFDKVGQMFRLPRMLRGDVRDYNRSTANASIDFAEVQVFGPIRQEFDWRMNKFILPALGARYHLFRSNSPSVRDPEALAIMVERMVKANVLIPEEARALCSDVFNVEFSTLGEPWTKQPIALTLANYKDPAKAEEGAADEPSLDTFNENGGMSMSGGGPTQETLGVSKKDVFAGEHGDDDEEDEEDEDELDEEKARLRKLRVQALMKLHKFFRDEEKRKAEKRWAEMEKVTIRLTEEEMRKLVIPDGE